MKSIQVLPLLLLLLVANRAWVQDAPRVFEGKIDRYPVIAEFSTYDSSCELRYFYLNQRKDIRLQGVFHELGRISLSTPDNGDEKQQKETMELSPTDSGFSGTWSLGPKKLTIILGPVHPEKYPNPFDILPEIQKLKKESLFEYIRISGFAFSPDEKPASTMKSIRWWKEKYSGIRFPRLVAGYDTAVLLKINASLLEKQLLEAAHQLECTGSPYGEYELSIGELFIHPSVFSFSVTITYYCGGAHPDFGTEGLNFDGKTGRLLDFDELFWLGKKAPPKKQEDSWYTYREKTVAPKIVALLKASYPIQMKKPKSEDGCDYSDPEVWQFPSWYFTKKGIYVGAYFPRYHRDCDQPDFSIIPYKSLQPYLNPGSGFVLPR